MFGAVDPLLLLKRLLPSACGPTSSDLSRSLAQISILGLLLLMISVSSTSKKGGKRSLHKTSAITIPEPRLLVDFDNTSAFPTQSALDHRFEVVSIPDCAQLSQGICVPSLALVHAEETHLLCDEDSLNTYTGSFSCRISDAGESGLGVYAASSIARGQVVVRERPLLIYPQLLPYRASAGRHYAELEDALGFLSPQSRDSFFSLANCHPLEPSVAKSIIDTNSLHIGKLPGGVYQYGAVCANISRINHRFALFRSHGRVFS